MRREEAWALVEELIQNPNLRKHCLAAEAAMRGLYRHFAAQGMAEGTEEEWAVAGLLHDADYEVTEKSPERHTDVVIERLASFNVTPEVVEAIRGHADKTERTTMMARALYACDELTGLITAAALVRPDKKLAGLTVESVLRRFREPSFARSANRDMIRTCEPELGLPLPEFTGLVLASMQAISDDLGL